jgi:hypothetical protein
MLQRSERGKEVLAFGVLLLFGAFSKLERDSSAEVSKRGLRANDMEENVAKLEVFLARIKVGSSNVTGTSTERCNQNNRETLGNREIPVPRALLDSACEEARNKLREHGEADLRSLPPRASHNPVFAHSLIEKDFRSAWFKWASLETRPLEVAIH